MSAVEELARLVQWTGEGVRVFDWTEVEREIGMRFPSSFKEYVAQFPAGEYQTFLQVEQPRSSNDVHGYVGRLHEHLRFLRVVARGKAGFQYDIYPKLPGLLPWGRIGVDYFFCWEVTHSRADELRVVMVDTMGPTGRVLRGDMVDCIVDLLEDRIPGLSYVAQECRPPRFGPLRVGTPKPYRRPADDWDLGRAGLLPVSPEAADLVDELISLVGRSDAARVVDWPVVERHLRHPLPADYKRLIEMVGPGQFGDIVVANPSGASGDVPGLLDLTAAAIEDVNTGALVPAPDGPVVWGRAPGGWYCGWALGEYPTDQRPVMLFDRTSGSGGFGRSMTSYLAWHVRDQADWTASPWRVGEPE